MLNENSTISRRDFLKFTAKTAVVSSGLLSGCASMSSESAGQTASAIDIHHHYIPPELIEEVKTNGKTLGVEYFPPKDAKDNPLQIRFPKGNYLRPDPRMAEVNNRRRHDQRSYRHRHSRNPHRLRRLRARRQ